MPETIKQIYKNIETIYNTIANSLIGTCFNNQTIKYIEHQLRSTLRSLYPYYEFNPEIRFDDYSRSVILKMNNDFNKYPSISYTNYNTHDFEETKIKETYYLIPTLKCTKCNLLISSSGSLIDGDFSCEEFIIKNLLE